jgi:hypothetical protein
LLSSLPPFIICITGISGENITHVYLKRNGFEKWVLP